MSAFNFSDFAKSAFAVVAFMSVVIAGVAWTTHGDPVALALASGLPIGTILFWAFYSLKIQLQMKSEESGDWRYRDTDMRFGLSKQTDALSHLRAEITKDRRTLRSSKQPKARTERPAPTSPAADRPKDQWYQN